MHTIWNNLNVSLETLEERSAGTMVEAIGIEFTEIAKDHLRATMPIDERTKQPNGIMHGGASAALAETLGSMASALVIDNRTHFCVGISLNISHIRSVREGYVHGVAFPLHLGRSTHVWDIKIHDDEHRLIAASRLTVAIMEKKEKEQQNKKSK